jgi:dipeptidyl-peptidase-4
MARTLLCALFLAAAWSVTAQPPPPGPGRPPNVVWAPDGKRFVYLENRAVWLYDVPSTSRKELVPLARLEQKSVQPGHPPEITEWIGRRGGEQVVQWSSTGKDLLISAGGDLFLYHLDKGAWDQVTATPEVEHDPKLSPDGSKVAFRREHDLYALELASRTLTRLTPDGSLTLLNGEPDWVYREELDLTTAYWWSPDSTRIAYLQFDVGRETSFPLVSMMQPKARLEPQLYPQPGTANAEVRLGVISLGGIRRWMDLGDPRDRLVARVVWAPDGHSLAVERFNRVQNQVDLLMADTETGVARVVIHEQDPHWINWNNDLRFLKGGDRFLWGSERDGFHHLYLYSVDGKRFTQLTRGNWETTGVAGVDETTRQVFYTSTEASPLERQLYRVDFDGRRKQRLTAEKGTHYVSMSPTCDYYLDTYSALNQPPGVTVRDRGGERAAVWAKPVRPPDAVLPVELMDFRASDGDTLYARLTRPPGFVEGRKYPVVVMVYGGPTRQEVRDAWHVNPIEQELARKGFLIWQLDNRGSAGRGHEWETRVFHNLGAQELKDQEEGVDYLLSLGFADPARIGIHGWSYGGYLTLYALANSTVFRAGAAGAPVADWRNYDSIYTERYMGLPDDNHDGYRRSSPIPNAANVKARLLLVHNMEDDVVHFQNTLQMAAALEQEGKDFEMLVYPQTSHGVAGGLRHHLEQAIVQFFERALQ